MKHRRLALVVGENGSLGWWCYVCGATYTEATVPWDDACDCQKSTTNGAMR